MRGEAATPSTMPMCCRRPSGYSSFAPTAPMAGSCEYSSIADIQSGDRLEVIVEQEQVLARRAPRRQR